MKLFRIKKSVIIVFLITVCTIVITTLVFHSISNGHTINKIDSAAASSESTSASPDITSSKPSVSEPVVSEPINSNASSSAPVESENSSSESTVTSSIINTSSSSSSSSNKENVSSNKNHTSSKNEVSKPSVSKPSTTKPSTNTSTPTASGNTDYIDTSKLTYTQADVGKVVGYNSALKTDVTVVSVAESFTGTGRKCISITCSDGTVQKIVECKYCHEMPCPDGGGNKCSAYNVKLDGAKTCQYCSRPIGNGYNGTCEQLIDWTNGGKHSCNYYD